MFITKEWTPEHELIGLNDAEAQMNGQLII
jgi:hypothetical protein